MAICNIVIARSTAVSTGDEYVPVLDSVVVASESITTSGTSQQSTSVVPPDDETRYWVITPTANVWVKFGANPTAAAASDWLCLSNQRYEFKAIAGHKVAVIEAAT